jgi:hypothetical protein
MATTTPNFGWAVPTSTDLVKNGAVAIETLGDSIDASLVDLKGGTTGQVLKKNTDTDMDFIWSSDAAGGGGKVLQVVAATYSTETQSTTNTYVDTGLTATITPSSATSKVLVIMTQNGVAKNGDTAVNLRLVRGATTLAQIGVLLLSTSSALYQEGNGNIAYLDSPATTSATTYKTTFNSGSNISFTRVQNNSSVSSIILMEIGA